MTFYFMLFFVLLLCSAFFSGSETALFSLSNIQIHNIKKTKKHNARILADALSRPRDMLVAILLGNEFANVALSIIGAGIVNHFFSSNAKNESIAAVCAVTPVVLVFGEIIPKNISIRYAPTIARFVIRPLAVFYSVTTPFRVLLTAFADKVISIFGGRGLNRDGITEDEYRKLVDIGTDGGAIVEEERELIHNVFEFTDKVAADIMTSFEDAFMLPLSSSYDEIREDIKRSAFSRVPFYKSSRENIVGIFHVNDMLAIHREVLSGKKIDISRYLKSPIFVSVHSALEQLLREFQSARIHMAFVKDDDEKIVGLVTMDDVLEELFGEMTD